MKKLLPILCILLFITSIAFSQAPANDDCENAIEITLGTNTCSNVINGTTENATQSNTSPAPSCDFAGGAYDDDVWYKFTAAQSGIVQIQFSNITGGTDNFLSMSIDTGTDCSLLSQISCSYAVPTTSPFTLRVFGGTTYYLRLFSPLNNPAEYKSFSFCAYIISNDECISAKELTVGDINNYTSFGQYGTTDGSTQSSTTPLPACEADGINDDVWYTFTAASTGNTMIRFNALSNTNIVAQAYEGNCASLSLLDCATTSIAMAYLNINAIAGSTYYIRVFTTDPNPAVVTDFYIYAHTLTPAPANDDCDNAMEVTLGDGSCSIQAYGNTLGATQSSNTPAPDCNASGTDDDIWFKFTSNENRAVRIEVVNGFSSNNSGISVQAYAGSCGVLTPISCNTYTGLNWFGAPFTFQINTTASTDYYFRVFTTDNDPAKFSSAGICAYYLPLPPVNDECADAVVLTTNITSQCSNVTAGTTIGATASSQPGPGCFGVNADDDVWYKFAATSVNHIITVSPTAVNGIQQYTAFQVFSGNCGTLTELNCVVANTTDAPAQQVITNLVIGDTFYVRVYSLFDEYAYKGGFDICIATPNDDCSHAEELTINSSSSCDAVTTGNTNFGTNGGNADCTNQTFLYIDDAVWYKFTAIAPSQKITVTPATVNGADDIAFQFFEGNDCNSLNINACINNTIGSSVEENTFTGLIIGNTYYLKVYSQENLLIAKGAFTICLSSNNNDECESATTVTVNPHNTCDATIAGSTTGATQSLLAACAGFNDDDVWYKFTAISATQKITVTPAETNGIDDIVLETFYGDCSGMWAMACVNNTIGNAAEEKFLTGLVPGNVYYFRVYSAGDNSGNGDFTICITSYNDNCNYVETLIPNTDENCAAPTTGSTIITGSSNNPGCVGDADDNNWYVFQATATNHTIRVTPAAVNGIDDAVIEIFYGFCGGMSSIACTNNTSGSTSEEAFLTGLSIGNWYYVRVYSHATGAGEGSYDICITTSTTPPANDECINATAIDGSVNTTALCNTLVRGNNYFATNGSLLNCNNQIVDDVWYSFIALGTTNRISVTTTFQNGINNPNVQAFSGACNSLTSIGCSSFGSSLFISTIPGNVYYIRVYGDGTNQGEFDLCIATPYTFNDDCLGATTVPVNNDNTCTVTTSSTTVNASSSGLFGNCLSGAADDDVWLKFTAMGAHSITVTPSGSGGITDAVVELYDGSCSGLSSLACANNTNGSAPEILTIGLNPGSTYLIRVYSAGNGAGNRGAFTVCINNTIENDECIGALTIPVNNDGSCTNTFAGTTVGSTSSNDIPFCNGMGTGFGGNNVWYKFIAGATAYNINITPTSAGGIVNPSWQLMSGTCGSLVSLGCTQVAATFENLIPGNTYYLLVYSTNGNTASMGAFDICIKSVSLANDICSGAVDIPISNDVTCITNIAGTTSGALNSFSRGIKDVWYKFVATETAHKIKVSPVADSIRNVAFEIYQGNCNSLNSLLQVNNNASAFDADTARGEIQSIENLIIGNTYYVRVYSAGIFRPNNIFDIAGSFNICVSLSANDVCSKAIEIPVNADEQCNAITLDSLDYATVTPGANYCNDVNNVNKDVWFKFIALDTLEVITVTTSGFQLFSGECGSLTSMRCGGPREIVGGFIIGNTYYVRAYTYMNTNLASTKFSICISKGAINNECGGAIALPVNTGIGCTIVTNGSTKGSSLSSNSPCDNTNNNFYFFPSTGPRQNLFGNDVWYKFIATATQHKVTVEGTTPDMNLFLSVYSGSCASLSPIVCINDYSPLPGSTDEEAVALDNLAIGNTYYVRVYKQASGNDGADFTICITAFDPLNDLCSNAITVPVNSGDNCIQTVTGSNVSATRSYDAAYINYNYTLSAYCPANANADVFYKFIATAASLKITVAPTPTGGIDDVMFQVYEGNCGSFSQIAWADLTAYNREEITRLDNLTVGNTYYVRVSNANGQRTSRGSFIICINEPPLNDLCSGAVALTLNADNNCTSQTAGTTVGATPINGHEDVWYKFVATASEHRISVTPGTMYRPVFALYKGNCNNLVQIREDIEYYNAGVSYPFQAYDSLTVGNTYYIRVWSLVPDGGDCPKYANINYTGTFTICVSAPAMPNDLIDRAISLTVNSGAACNNSLSTDNIGSTYSLNSKDCYNPTNYYQRDYVSDVWFKFIATTTSHNISVTPAVSSGIHNPAFAVYERSNANYDDNILSRGCVNFTDGNSEESQVFNGLVPGKVYFIRVMSDINPINQGNFNICITTPALPAYTSKIITYAGDGTGAGISATNSKLFSPTDVATENKGNVYIADSGRVKKISLADGTVTIVAGTGVPGVSGDGGLATLAQIPLKVKIAVDNSGNIFIADYEGAQGVDTAYISKFGTVRKVNASTGVISKIIDMPIDLVEVIPGNVFFPTTYIYKSRQVTGITTDATGNMYITVNWQEPIGNSVFAHPGAKHYNIYKQTPGGIFSELHFGDHFGYGLSIDNTGNLYVAVAEGLSPCAFVSGFQCYDGTPADFDTRHIRKITPGAGSSIIAGKSLVGVLIGVGPFGYTGDGGPAVDAQLKPTDVKVDAAGNVYIADGNGYWNGTEYGNYAIRKINTGGIITTIAGTGVNDYSGDNGPASLAAIRTPLSIAVDSSGNIYVADVKKNESPLTAGNRIRKIIPNCSGGIAMSNKGNTFYITAEKIIYKECDTIARVLPVAPVVFNRDVTAKVWIEPTVPMHNSQPYVARHYEVNPLTEPSAATTRLTLYFTQTEFDNYNGLVGQGSKLPIDGTDAGNHKSRLVVIQRDGVSADGTGLQETYSTVNTTINPNDNDIVWNSSQNRWEVSVTVTGGGGFFLQTIPDCPVNTWTSAANNGNWSDASNWCSGVVPTSATDAIVPTGATPYPALNNNANINNLEIQAGATVSIESNSFTINGIITGTGTLSVSPSSSVVANASTTLLFTPSSNTIKNLTVNAGTTTLGNALNITAGSSLPNSTGVVTVIQGAVLASNGNLTFKSNEFGTARLAQGSDAGNFVTGNATIERYIPNNNFRSWRLLSVPTHSSGQTIRQAWQEGDANPNPLQNNLPGYGTQITGTGSLAAAQAAGFDNTAAKSTLLYWTGIGWGNINSTNIPIDQKQAYFLYLRGERSKGVTGSIGDASATTLRTSGNIYMGNQQTAVPTNGFAVVGNVYPSAISFTGLERNNVNNVFYVWDSKKLNGTSLGAYQTFSGINGYNCILAGGSYVLDQPNTLIESGQAFLVQGAGATGGGTITLKESSKTNGNTGLGLRPSNTILKTDIRLYNADGMRDAATVVFDNAYSNEVDGYDALKLGNPGENISIQKSTARLAIEGRQPVTDADTIKLGIWNLQQREYKIELSPEHLPTDITAYIEDDYLKTSTPIDISSSTSINFTVDANAASSAANRFRILFKKTKPLMDENKPAITIAPNPVENGIASLLFKNKPKGVYNVRIIDAIGQIVMFKHLIHTGGSASQNITLPTSIISGHYKVEITAPNKLKEVISIMVNKN